MKWKRLSKRTTAFILACCIVVAACASYVVQAYKSNPPSWVMGSARDSWSQEVEAKALSYVNKQTLKEGIKPTNLGLMHATWNPGPLYTFPYTGVTYMDTIESGDSPTSDFENFKGSLIYCSTAHLPGADLWGGTQFFFENYWDENNIPDWVQGSSEEERIFNFYLMVCAIGLADNKTKGKGAIGDDVFGGVAPNYNGAAEFLATFPIVYGVETSGFDMNDMSAALQQYRNNVLVQRIQNDVADNPKVKAELESMKIVLVGDSVQLLNYMEYLFCCTWRAANTAIALHSASPDYAYEISEDGDHYSVVVSYPYTPVDGAIFNGILRFDVTTFGDWVNQGYVYDDIQRVLTYTFTSDTGIAPDDGIVAKMTVSEIGDENAFFIASNNSKLATFKCWSRALDNKGLEKYPLSDPKAGSFDLCQTFFAVAGGNEILVRAGIVAGDGTVEVKRFKHEEGWQSDYNVDLAKFDSETGKALEGAVFDILEKDTLDSQLPSTNLDDTGPQGSLNGQGTFVVTEWEEGDSHDTIDENYSGYNDSALVASQVTLYNWGNDKGTQFTRWDDPWSDACGKDTNVTGADGHLYYGDNYGNNSGDSAHGDTYRYKYQKGYCTGHPAPVIDYVEVPEEETDDDGDVTNQDEIDAAIEENKRLHREAWGAWNAEVQKCDQLATEGGFFHCITPGDIAKTALEEDRDVFYINYISLTYDYSAEETKARTGYILHGLHTDDIPLEWRIVTSSQFKDYNENGLSHNKGGSSGGNGSNDDDADLFSSYRSMASIVEPGESAEADIIPATTKTESRAANFVKLATGSDAETTSDADEDYDEVAADQMEDYEIGSDNSIVKLSLLSVTKATGSDADGADIAGEKDLSGTKSTWTWTGLVEEAVETVKTFLHIGTESDATKLILFSGSMVSASDDDDDDDGSSSSSSVGSGLRNTIKLLSSEANKVILNRSDILDWTFILYNHRTEGEIHFNKRDIDLQAKEDGYDSYGQSNGDGTIEGAVYGLFAAEDIVHSDGKTGKVYEQGDLVAVTTTDRNGDASFMVVTEAPGYIYDYAKGAIIRSESGWANQAPRNLHIAEDESAAKESDMEEFYGHNLDNSEITGGNGNDLTDTSGSNGSHTAECFNKHSSNQGYDDTYREGETTGYYPISNNDGNNGNCWIGRPLFANGENATARYYIKELSRSEGYELSVVGKDNQFTNGALTGEELNSSDIVTSEGTVAVTAALMMDVNKKENRFTVTSNGTVDGYDITLYNIPANAAFSTFTIQTRWDDSITHTEAQEVEVPVIGTAGQPVLIDGKLVYASVGDTITLPNGQTTVVNAVSESKERNLSVTPENSMRISIPTFAGSISTTVEDFLLDADWAMGSSRAKAPENAPWTLIELTGAAADDWAACLHDGMIAAGMEAFNRITVEGPAEIDGNTYAVVRYAYVNGNTALASVYDEVYEILYVKQAISMNLSSGTTTGFVYIPYTKAEMVSYTELNGFITSAIVNRKVLTAADYTYPATMDLTTVAEMAESYWIYDGTEQARASDGSLATRKETRVVEVPGGYVTEEMLETVQDVTYDGTKYVIHMDVTDGDVLFKITYGTDATADINIELAKNNGVISVSPTPRSSESYVEFVMLPYLNDKEIISDAGTVLAPIGISERPIRQKIKITKDIQTLQETKTVWYCLNCGYENSDNIGICGHCNQERTTEEAKTIAYAHDTYAAVHSENLSSGNHMTDWLTKLLNGDSADETARNIPNFRFKAYLKSNLERLYRDNDGNIVWLDRNGNSMTPVYQDTNGDGNHDTFIWKYDTAYNGDISDFPEKRIVSDEGSLESTNVQKIYTKVTHNTGSMTTSAQANNVWDDYNDPQIGISNNVGELEGYSTSQRMKSDGSAGDLSGKAVDSNAALYSYDGKNVNVAQSDKINSSQNSGYTRLLETRLTLMEDGTGTRNVEQYNYEKFFDAILAANTDIWDDDMHSTYTGSSMSNYPGQHWFETHYEKYQKDDADPDHTLANTDGVDSDNTAGGDRDTSFKPFRWIRENIFGNRADYETYPAEHNEINTETQKSTSAFAKANADASDAVRQFAAKWYLEDEAAKLMINNGVDEDIARSTGTIDYDEAIYDEALFNAIAKAYNYLKPFYVFDLDTIYAVEWDSVENGGADGDYTTLSIDTSAVDEHYNTSSYLPYGIYVIVEQQPERIDGVINDFENRSYTIEKPKEVIVPSVYDPSQSNDTNDNYHTHYYYDYSMTTEEQAKADNYLIRFGDEWAHNNRQDERQYVIRAHNNNGDFEVYKYGLDIDKLTGSITYSAGNYNYAGVRITQDVYDPLKDYYNTKHRGAEGNENIGIENGGNDNSHYNAIDKTNDIDTANGTTYAGTALVHRFFYASISEDEGKADNIMYKSGATNDNNVSGMQWKDDIHTMTGQLTAYDKKYAPMLVPWTLIEPAGLENYSAADFTGYAYINVRDSFYTARLRINKVDSETGEYIIHDNAIFALYAGSRYNSFAEIEQDAQLIADTAERSRFLAQFKPGDARFYLQDTIIVGTKEFLEAMYATELTKTEKGTLADPIYTGCVKKGTPICVESERIMLTDSVGAKTGQMTVYATLNDVLVASEESAADKLYADQNTGYFITPQPIGAGVYVLAEIKAPDGYVKSNPVPYEVYSDKTQYYVDGDMYSKVSAVRYEGNLLE